MNRNRYQSPQRHIQPQSQPQTSKPPKVPAVTVLKIRPVQEGNLIGFIDLKLGNEPQAIEVLKWRLIQRPDGNLWVSPPQETWVDKDGIRRYLNLFVPPKHWIVPIEETVFAAWKVSQAKTGQGATNDAS